MPKKEDSVMEIAVLMTITKAEWKENCCTENHASLSSVPNLRPNWVVNGMVVIRLP